MANVGSLNGKLQSTALGADGVCYADSNGLIQVTSTGSSTQVLTSNGAGVAPTFQNAAVSGIVTINGNSGSVTGSTVTFTGSATGLTFSGSSTTMTLGGKLAVASGGTNATSFTQSNGIVAYNGTSLVNYAGPQIDSSGRLTNTSQPFFYSFCSTNKTNVTGNSVTYTVIFDSTTKNVGSSFNTGTGLFTAPVTGLYSFSTIIGVTGEATGTGFLIGYIGSAISQRLYQVSVATSDTGTLLLPATWAVPMTAGDTMGVQIFSDNVGQTVSVVGSAVSSGSFNFNSSFSGYLIC